MKRIDPDADKLAATLASAVDEWRDRNQLKAGDPVFLLIELFRIHQTHWDQVRRRDLPPFEPLQAEMAQVLEASRHLRQQLDAVASLLRLRMTQGPTVTRATAVWAALAGILAGYLLGKVFA